jgi:hypothetical protein
MPNESSGMGTGMDYSSGRLNGGSGFGSNMNGGGYAPEMYSTGPVQSGGTHVKTTTVSYGNGASHAPIVLGTPATAEAGMMNEPLAGSTGLLRAKYVLPQFVPSTVADTLLIYQSVVCL